MAFLKDDNRSKQLQNFCEQHGLMYHFIVLKRITWKSKSHINNNFEVVNAGNPDHEALLLFLTDINTKTVKKPKLIFRYNFSQF